MALKNLSLEVVIPSGVEVKVDKSIVTIKGAKGVIQKDFYHPKISVSVAGNIVKLDGKELNSREKIIVPTFEALIKNAIKGVNKPYVYELKILSGHFPIKVSIENGKVVIKNLFGEKVPRLINMPQNVKVNISGNMITVESVDKEAAGQTAANIEKTTIRAKFDKRVFQDGVYIVKKADDE